MEQSRNKDQKCPVVLLLDTSGSMAGQPIDELNKALVKLKEDILNEPTLSSYLEIGIVAFDDDARVERAIDLISPETELPILNVGGVTNLLSGMNKAMEIVIDRLSFYKSIREHHFRPYIILFTDGAPTNTTEEIEQLDQTIQMMSDEKRFVFIPFGLGNADMHLLSKLAAQNAYQKLNNKAVAYRMTNEIKFSSVFEFVSASISSVINQEGRETVQLPPDVAEAVIFDLGA